MNNSRNFGETPAINPRNHAGWHCDSCDQLITSIEDGWVEWLSSEEDNGAEIAGGLRLVHRESCRYDVRTVFRERRSIVEGLCLERFVGSDGLSLLLSLLSAGELPRAEVIELIKRVQIPGYELACNVLGQEHVPLSLSSSLGHACYLQSEINEALAQAFTKSKAA